MPSKKFTGKSPYQCQNVRLTDIITGWELTSDKQQQRHGYGGLTMAPITLRVQISEVQAVLLPKADLCGSARDFASDEGPATSRTLVVE